MPKRTGQQTVIRDLLARISSRPSSDEPFEFPACERCGRELELDETGRFGVPHACCRCLDLRRYRNLDGMTEICPCAVDAAKKPTPIQMHAYGIPREHVGASLGLIADPPRTEIQLWASVWPRPDAHFLLLAGGVGSGKTSAAAAIAASLYERHGVRCYFTGATGLMGRLRAAQAEDSPEDPHQVMHMLKNVPLLIIDDIGKERGTEFAREQLFDVVDHRWAEQMATIVTGNAPSLATLDEPMLSRIGSGLVCKFPDKDRRMKR